MKNLKVNKKQPEPLTAQISDESGLVLIAETYGPTCRERADLFVKAVNCHAELVDALEYALKLLGNKSANHSKWAVPYQAIKNALDKAGAA